jgi:hypothetical protein
VVVEVGAVSAMAAEVRLGVGQSDDGGDEEVDDAGSHVQPEGPRVVDIRRVT